MNINYATILRGRQGIAYDISFQGLHINMTMMNGMIVECNTIIDGYHTTTSIGTQADVCQYLITKKTVSIASPITSLLDKYKKRASKAYASVSI